MTAMDHVELAPLPAKSGMTVHERILAVLRDLPAIGKNQRNQQQGFNFRGVDDVLDELNPLLAKHGVFFVPTVLERQESCRQTVKGGTLWVVNLHIRYTFYGLAGDQVVADGWGEGTDSGDKSTQKAMTGAMKYVLFQTFAIATHERELDADETTQEDSVPARVPAVKELIEQTRIAVTTAGIQGWVKDNFVWPWTADECGAILGKAGDTILDLEEPFDPVAPPCETAEV